MRVKKACPFFLFVLVVGFNAPLAAQGTLPVEVLCVKGAGTFKPLCNDTKKAINASSSFRQARNGSRYVLTIYAQKNQVGDGRIIAAIAFSGALSDRLSQVFPYSAGGIPWILEPNESRILGIAIVEGGLPVFVDAFSAMTNEINLFGSPRRTLAEVQDQLSDEIQFQIEKVLKEKSNP